MDWYAALRVLILCQSYAAVEPSYFFLDDKYPSDTAQIYGQNFFHAWYKDAALHVGKVDFRTISAIDNDSTGHEAFHSSSLRFLVACRHSGFRYTNHIET
jgi:hypothetical protein